jgi:hypothetical protein
METTEQTIEIAQELSNEGLKAEAQSIFDEVVAHLRKQNARSFRNENGLVRCLYRSDDGLKCAVGCLIPDNEYTPEMEKWMVLSVVEMLSKPLQTKLGRHLDLLKRLQHIHDDIEVGCWEDKFAMVSDVYGLAFTVKETTNEATTTETTG